MNLLVSKAIEVSRNGQEVLTRPGRQAGPGSQRILKVGPALGQYYHLVQAETELGDDAPLS